MSEPSKHVLIVDDEPNLRKVLSAQLSRSGFVVHQAADGHQALDVMAAEPIDVVIADLRMPAMDGLTLLKQLTQDYPKVPAIMITAHGTVDTAVEALKLGAFDYVTKPFDREELQSAIVKAVKTRDVWASDIHSSKSQLIGQSAQIREVESIIERVADTQSTVLITGESGTGKEVIARALHERSARRTKPFVRVNCAAIPTELIESELFGYEKGAFTGAVTSKPGRFELAHDGTLFLDEIGEIPPHTQAKLLRVLQEYEFERVGGIKTLKVDVRLVAATNQDLAQAIQSGSFREDLYYRLNVVRIHLPALRERAEDIPLLTEHFLRRLSKKHHKVIESIEPETLKALQVLPWKGNIRELENVLERGVLFCDGNVLTRAHLPAQLFSQTLDASITSYAPPGAAPSLLPMPDSTSKHQGAKSLKDAVKEMTRHIEVIWIRRALEETQGNVTRAAQNLGVSRKSLQLKMKELGIEKP